VNPEQIQDQSPRTSPAAITRHVTQIPVTHTDPVAFEQASLGMRNLATTVGSLWWPAEVSFAVGCDGHGRVTAAWLVVAADQRDAAAGADTLTGILAAVTPWLGLGRPEAPATTPAHVSGVEQILTAGPATPTTVVSAVSAAWRYAAAQKLPCQFTVTLAGGLRAPHPPASSPIDPVDPGIPEQAPHLTCRLSLHCEDPRGETMAALLCGDTYGPQTLQVTPVRPGHNRGDDLTELSTDLLGHLLATPARIPLFHQGPPTTLTEVLDAIRATPARHLLLQGATGQGKSTFLTHLADHALSVGDTVVAVDVHDGDLAHQVAHAARRHGRDPLFVDFSAPDNDRPRIALTRPPTGVDEDRWARDLYEIIRDALWADMPTEYFGPVGERALTVLLSALVRDPEGPAPLTDLPRLVSTLDRDYRTDLLTRVNDPALTRAVLTEVMPMLTSKDPGNSMIWLTSKIDPLIGSPAIARILDTRENDVDIDAAVAAGRPVLIYAPAGVLGDSGAKVLVSTLLHRLWLSIRSRPVDPSRRPVELVLDEWQTYPLPALGRMLAEGRKFGVHLNLANQSLSAIPAKLLQTALANTGTVATFRTGPVEARILDPLFRSVTAGTLQRLPRHRLAVAAEDADMLFTPPPLEPR
jgi:hypothetical protein